MKRFGWIFLLLLFTLSLSAQKTPEEQFSTFRSKVSKYYYDLESSDLQNFSCLFTSGAYINFVNEKYDSTFYYPLKLIWTKEGKIYNILQPYPTMNEENRDKMVLGQIQMVKTQFKGFLVDWQNFLMFNPMSDIPENPEVRLGKDTIQVAYTSGEGALAARVKKLFIPSGKLLQVTVYAKDNKVITAPVYKELGDKWICVGWETQIYRSGEVSSGSSCRMELQNINGYYMPVRVEMLMQSAQKPEEKYLSNIYLKDYAYNLNLQEIEKPEKSAEPSASKEN